MPLPPPVHRVFDDGVWELAVVYSGFDVPRVVRLTSSAVSPGAAEYLCPQQYGLAGGDEAWTPDEGLSGEILDAGRVALVRHSINASASTRVEIYVRSSGATVSVGAAEGASSR